MLVRHASGLRVEDVTRFLRHWATLVDPDGADDAEKGRQDLRTVYLAKTFGGMGDLRGNLTPEALALAETLFDQVMDELYQDEQRGDVPERTAAQRRHDAFIEILRRAAAWDPQNGRQAHPSLLLLLDFDTMAAAPAAQQAGDERAADQDERSAEQAEQASGDGVEGDIEPGHEHESEPGPGPGPAAGCEGEGEGEGEGDTVEAPVGEILLAPDLAAQTADLGTPELDDSQADDDAGDPADAGAGVVPRPEGPDDDHGRGSGAGTDDRADDATDSGRPDAGRPGRGRGDPVRVVPTSSARFLTRGTAKATPWDGPMITAQTALRLACDAGLSRLISGPDGEVLDHGREKRLFTPPQRRAILKRYGFTCAWPDCDRPAGWLRIHHIDWWTRDRGPTDLDNGIPFCPCHHTCVHEGGFTLQRELTTGQITFWRPDGTQLLPQNPNEALWAEVRPSH
jgi:hypothetical protein